MNHARCLIVLVLLCVCTSVVLAKQYTDPVTKFTFWYPDDWKTQQNGTVFNAWSPTPGPEFYFFPPSKALSANIIANADKLKAALQQELSVWFSNIKFTTLSFTKVGNIPVALLDGTAVLNNDSHWLKKNAPVAFSVALYYMNEKFFIVCGFVDPAKLTTYKPLMTKILKSGTIKS